ncbi:MAG: nitroreductase family protein [Nitrospira sp.]|nr:nitroreductase family protein [Nitrospira sp.]
MHNPAQTDFPIHDLLALRWSPRAFAERPIEGDKVNSLFEAARWAPSSNNEQPWRFIVAGKDDEAQWNRLLACVEEGNRIWAVRAPMLILSVARLNFEKCDKPNRHALHDVGMATGNLVLQATALGLVARQMAGFDVEKARGDLNIPFGYEPVAMIAVGYPGDPRMLPDTLRQRELASRERRATSTFVYVGEWGKSVPFIS